MFSRRTWRRQWASWRWRRWRQSGTLWWPPWARPAYSPSPPTWSASSGKYWCCQILTCVWFWRKPIQEWDPNHPEGNCVESHCWQSNPRSDGQTSTRLLQGWSKTADDPISGQNYPLKNVVDTGFNLNRGKQPNIVQCSQTWLTYSLWSLDFLRKAQSLKDAHSNRFCWKGESHLKWFVAVIQWI